MFRVERLHEKSSFCRLEEMENGFIMLIPAGGGSMEGLAAGETFAILLAAGETFETLHFKLDVL